MHPPRKSGEASLPDFTEPRGDDNVRVRVPVSAEEWVHARRMEKAREAKRLAERQRTSLVSKPVTMTCAGCDVSEETTSLGMGSVDIKARHVGLPFRLGLAGVPLCGRCANALPAVLAAERLPDGRTRGEALDSLVGQAQQPSRGEQDREAVRALSQRG